MAIPMTRARLYVLIDAFERDMRTLLGRFMHPELTEEELLENLYDKALTRQRDDASGSLDTPLVEYLDLREAYDLLNRHRKFLPEELAREIRECTASMDRLVGIRRRVMHPRPLLADDGEAAPMILNQFSTRFWSETRRVLSQLDTDPSWEPLVTLSQSDTTTLHNLPLPDYDETGLIGRSKEVAHLVETVKRGRESVITIIGEGGIGKTALALEVAYNLIDDSDEPFDAVLWTSLKYERLTAQGVEEIANSARDLTNAIRPLGATFDASFQGGLEDLSQGLIGLKTLVVLDNFETIGGLEFTQLYETLPDSVRYLVTSRIGVGQYERRFPLEPLDQKDSLRLLNDFIRARRLASLQRLSGQTRIEIVTRLRNSPLGIRWFVLAVESGRDPLSLIRDQSELLEFCVRSVYDALSAPAKEVLSALSVLARPVTADELVVLLDIGTDGVNVGLQELIRGSLVRRDAGGGNEDLALRVRLTETASLFLSKRVIVDRDYARLVGDRESKYRANEERRVADAKSRSLAPIVVRTSGPQDIPTAQILRRALLASQNGNIESALEDVETAQRLNPELWEVDRVEGFIVASAGDASRALLCYERAYRKAHGEGRGVVAHFLAGHLARNVRDLQAAIVYAREANDVLGTHDTAVALGNYLVWYGDFEEGVNLIQPATVAAQGKAQLIAVSSLAGAYRRWGESAGKDERNPVLEYRRGLQGLSIALASLETGVADERIRNIATECAITTLHGATAALSDGITLPDLSETLDRLTKSQVRLTRTPSWDRLGIAAQRLTLRSRSAASQRLMREITELGSGTSFDEPSSRRYSGEIVSLQSVYGFIRHPSLPENIFFHKDDLGIGQTFDDLHTGALVSFDRQEEERGPRAVNVVSEPI
ncbi:AAA family ATPase [Janibacter sp. Soil728]|uniref:AAA family ATPase n=1 Tax=Janibacter sp. Soil728 TaxID=1736393 RepID=UPI0009EBD9B9|nr:AAA family ATPase [Janibacter sp. Soil728]